MSQVILFDLDGTLTESGEGITKCVQYALGKLGITETDLNKLRCFIGPPLKQQFMDYAGFSSESAEMAVAYYRERYTQTGMFENRLYDKIPDLLELLKINDKILGVATSKPEIYAKQILEHFGIADYFQVIVGSEMDGTRTNKVEVIEEALRRLNMDKARDKVLMVGDREHDVQGAITCGVQCIGVAYGYGTRQELENAGAVYIAETVEDLGILASPNDEETSEHVESVRKQPKEEIEEKEVEKEPEEMEIKICKPRPPKIHPVRAVWRSLYPILIHYGLALFVSALAFLYFDWAASGNQDILNPLDIMEKVIDTNLYQMMISSVISIAICFILYKKDQIQRREGFLGQGADFVWSPPVLWFSIIVLGVAGGQLANDLIVVTRINKLFPGYTELVTEILADRPMWLVLLCVGIAAPIAEELVFRGLVFRRLKDWLKPGAAIIISSLVFGLYHGNVQQFLFASIIGCLLAFVYHTTGTLWSSILLHIVVNIWSLVGTEWWYFIWNKVPFGVLIGMLIEIIVCVIPGYILYITYKKKNSKINDAEK